jgi:rhamnose utilization protein RhaD (predicted bifunctional aldolase and dehydrogenase)
MSNSTESIESALIDYCAKLGSDPLLVQGAGGNASWKAGDTLWVKASGTWLADAADKAIFVPVDLDHLKTAIEQEDFSVTPQCRGDSPLKPSIETLLHALMPQKIVVHLHAIEILAHLVKDHCRNTLTSLLDPAIQWVMVDYFKPGAALAAAINSELKQKPDACVVFLKNHGVVVGGQNLSEVSSLINKLIASLRIEPETTHLVELPDANPAEDYTLIQDSEVQLLALNADLFNRLTSSWVLYPDHVVFLGAKAYCYPSWNAFDAQFKDTSEQPELVFIAGIGVFVKESFHKAKQAQLRCYYDVLIRQKPTSPLHTLSESQIAELLNWDAEKYRMTLNKA